MIYIYIYIYIYNTVIYIYNVSLQAGVFPDELKIAIVMPLLNSDGPEFFSNYRPLSLLCTVSEIFEKIMYDRLLRFLDKYKILFSFISIWISETSFQFFCFRFLIGLRHS